MFPTVVNVDENPLLRERDVPAGWPGMRGTRVVVTGAPGVWARASYALLLPDRATGVSGVHPPIRPSVHPPVRPWSGPRNVPSPEGC